MLIKIEFKKSDIKDKYTFGEFAELKTIPPELRRNIFTKDELGKLIDILDHKPKSSEILKIDLLNNNIYERLPYPYLSSADDNEEAKKENKEYKDERLNSEGIGLYVIDSDYDKFIVDSDLLLNFMNEYNNKGATLSYEVIGTIKDILTMSKNKELAVVDRLLSLEDKLDTFSKTQQFNTQVGVHVSDLGLLNVKEVDVLLDACTDELQEWLNDGWRILSICPQPDQRRPDYVLGKNERTVDRARRRKNCS